MADPDPTTVYRYHYEALSEAIAILETLPPDARMLEALNALDRIEVEWRERYHLDPPPPLLGRHHRF